MINFKNALNVSLVNPDIPQNTGSIARTCAALEVDLHLVKPMGFKIDEKKVRRAGLDYWPYVSLTEHDSYAEFVENSGKTNLYHFSTKGAVDLFDVKFAFPASFVFGSETKGLSPEILSKASNVVKIAMPSKNVRSLNLSNSVSIAVYEGLRQFRSM